MKKIKNQNNIGDVFDVKSAVCREFDTEDLTEGIAENISYFCGFSNPEVVKKKKCISFNVSGNVHKGKVYIVLNFLDLFNVYYCDDNDIHTGPSTDEFAEFIYE